MPSLPPGNVQAHNTSSTSLMVTWNPVPQQYVHGILRGYTVTYRVENSNSGEAHNATTRKTSMEVTGLHKYTKYMIRVLAFTVKGNGNVSAWISVSTDEDGKYKPILFRADNLGDNIAPRCDPPKDLIFPHVYPWSFISVFRCSIFWTLSFYT